MCRLSGLSLRATFMGKVRKAVIMVGIAMPHFASILMVHMALLMLFSLVSPVCLLFVQGAE